MKKQILNLGKALNKAEKTEIKGGYIHPECEVWNPADCYGYVPLKYRKCCP